MFVKSWRREHRTGMVAIVRAVVDNPGKFAYGAVSDGETVALGSAFVTLQQAQAAADEESDCQQPCRCPGWAGPQ
jgi:hypothetical protein